MQTPCGKCVFSPGISSSLICFVFSKFFVAHLDIDKLLARRFLKSIHNITIEQEWLWLQLQWGDNIKIFWDAGLAIYNPSNTNQ